MPELDYKDFWVYSAGTVDQSWIKVVHRPCGATLFGDSVDDADDATLEELLFIAQAHRCSE